MTGFVLNTTGFVLNMTGFVLNDSFLNMTGFDDDDDESNGMAYLKILLCLTNR